MKTLADLGGTSWAGQGELWLDPLGNEVEVSKCTLQVVDAGIQYTWVYKDKEHQGSIELSAAGAQFTDSWHQPESMTCRRLEGRGLFQVEGTYGPDNDWGWRIGFCMRAPTGEVVLQMTNIAPWGEVARAVRIVCSPA